MSVEANNAIVRRFVEEVFGKGNLAALEEYLAPEALNRGQSVRPNSPAAEGSATPAGREAATEVFRSVHAAFPDLQVTIGDIFGQDDLVAVRHSWRGTHRGEILGIAPTGKTVVVQAMNIFRLADGKIVERWGGPDLYGLLRQLGATLTPPTSAQ